MAFYTPVFWNVLWMAFYIIHLYKYSFLHVLHGLNFN